MDPYTRKALQDTPYFKEPYYSSKPYLPEDLICEGSDSEQTEEEIRAKRKRYEKHAQLYTRGIIPTLQSTRLNHPLDNWTNPWRTQVNRRERLAPRVSQYHAPGLDTIDNTEIQQYGMSERNGTEGPDATHYSTFRTKQLRSTMLPISIEGRVNSSPWFAERDDSMTSRHSQTQRTRSKENTQIGIHDGSSDIDDGEYTGIRRGKRSIGGDGIWLKGSYPSKRARWEGLSMATPTPNPDHLGQRIQRPSAPVPSQLGNWDSTPRVSSPNTLSSFQSIPRIRLQSSNQEGVDSPLLGTPLSSSLPINIHPLTLPGWTPDFQPLYPSMLMQDLDMPSKPPVRNQSRSSARYYERGSHGTGHQFLESTVKREESPNNSFSFFQQFKTPSSIAHLQGLQSTGRYTLPLSTMPTASRPRATRNSPDGGDNSMAEALPPLPPSATKPPYATQPMIDEETSFVTEIAASSQNLSEFQYRKRRLKKKKPKSQVLPASHYEQQPQLISQQSLDIVEGESLDGIISDINAVGQAVRDLDGSDVGAETYQSNKSEQDAESEEGSEEQYEEEENVLASCPIAQWYAQSSVKIAPSTEEDEESEESGSDLEAMDSGEKGCNPAYSLPEVASGHVSPGNNPSTTNYPIVVISLAEEEKARNDRSSTSQSQSGGSSASQSLPKQGQQIGSGKSSMQPDEDDKVEAPRCIYDFSTQSFNTTPQRSALPVLSQDSSVHFQTDERKPQEGENYEESDGEGNKKDDEESYCRNTTPAGSEVSSILAEQVLKSGSLKSILQNSSHPDTMIQCRLSTSSASPDPSSQADAIGTPKSGSISSMSKIEVDYIENGATLDIAEPVMVEHIAPRTPEPVSQVLPPEQQTPWAINSTAPIPIGTPREIKAINGVDAGPHSREESETFEQNGLGDSSWQHIECPTIPENDEIRSFNDLLTPPRQPRNTTPEPSPGEPQNTQDYLEAATRNPWETPKRKPRKSAKRVSFGIPEENEEESETVKSTEFRRYSPPPLKPIEFLEDETLPDGTIVTGFKKHFSAIRSALRNPRRVILEDPITASSPSVGAMAEAFVTADREAPTEPSWETSRHLKPRKETTTNVIRQDDVEGLEDSIYSLESPTGNKGDDFQPDFDMDEVLGEAADFLGEWSVEADLQKAREAKRLNEVEDNGARRRRLFGIA